MHPARTLLLAALALLAAGARLPAVGPPAPRYTYREGDEAGIGKWYMGREIAFVMTYHGAGWLDRPQRVKEEGTEKLLKILGAYVKPGMTVCDMGAGSGYYTFPLAGKVGAKGKVLAVDVQKEMLAIIKKRAKAKKAANVETVLGTATDPKLPAGKVDLILLVDVYHEFSHPYEMGAAMVKALRPGGRLVFVEYRLEDPKVPILITHKMSEKQVKREMAIFPLKHVKTHGGLPWQHVIVFEKVKKK
jgi:SAM-dependent methyltransferase